MDEEQMPERREPKDSIKSATLNNVAPERPPLFDPEDVDAMAGTSSGMRTRGKPHRGSREYEGL